MIRLYSLTFNDLVARGVSRPFAGVLSDPGSYHTDLNILVGKTDWDYFIPEGVTDVLPLWDSNADSFVRWKRNGITEYVLLLHDDPNWSLIAKSEQGIMAKLWQEWIEFQDADAECRRFAEAIGFRHWEEALSFLTPIMMPSRSGWFSFLTMFDRAVASNKSGCGAWNLGAITASE